MRRILVKWPVSQPSIGLREAELTAQVVASGQLTQGELTARFEKMLAAHVGAQYAVACTSGTTALHLALAALGIGSGDAVLVPDLTFIATANAVAYTGARAIPVDIDPETWCIDLDDAAERLTPNCKAIIPVHLYGVPCDMDRLLQFADDYELNVVEDAAEGLGGRHNGDFLGTIGDCGIYSFYGNKVMTTGEGGAIVTNNGELADRLRLLRGQGQGAVRYRHDVLGFNYRFTELQAALGIAQLERLPKLLKERNRVMSVYRTRLSDYVCSYSKEMAPWQFTFLLPEDVDRDVFMQCMLKAGVDTRPAFVPIHLQPSFFELRPEYPHAMYVSEHGVSLPTYPELSTVDVVAISDLVIETVSGMVTRSRQLRSVS